MTDEDHEIHEEAPTDEEGHPIHPERGHRICGAEKSDRTTPTDHGRERDEYAYCLQPAGWGTDSDVGACRNHPYKGSQIGESNPNFKHGRTSEYFRSKLSDRQQEVYNDVVEELADDGEPDELLAAVVGRLLLLGEHAQDSSMLREARQWAADFGVLETAAERHELEHSGEVDTGDALDEATQAAVREALADRRGDS